MSKTDGPKIQYFCQTYEERKAGRSGTHLAIKATIPCSDARGAENRAERAFQSGSCVGADAFSVTADPDTGEADTPIFLTRLGKVPDVDPV